MLKTVDMLGLPFVHSDMEHLVSDLDNRLQRAQNTFLVTVNTEIIMYARKHEGYFGILKEADLITPDGVGIIMASRIFGSPIEERLTGYDLMMSLFHLASDKGYKIYLLGAEPPIIEEAVDRAKKDFPTLRLAGYHHGYFDFEDDTILEDIQSAEPDIVLVGLGVPRQEQWINSNRKKFKKGLFIGVGGSFDGLAGKVKRAPLIWQKLNIEWLYRLIQRPSRWKRMTVLPVFLIRVMLARLVGKRQF
ncbi:MAG TPA: WecB/TagA/CpsF family glycosyltransferase [Bacillales bacterium]|nr:WecB/TagA/CpsF family glycosyltransferase [Bacillales bacterium]